MSHLNYLHNSFIQHFEKKNVADYYKIRM